MARMRPRRYSADATVRSNACGNGKPAGVSSSRPATAGPKPRAPFSWFACEPLIHISTATDQDRSVNALRDPDESVPVREVVADECRYKTRCSRCCRAY